MNAKLSVAALTVSLVVAFSGSSHAQPVYSEDFTGTATSNSWYYFNGACLTAGSGTSVAGLGQIPSCTTVRSSYYGENLTGGQNGASGSGQTLPDPAGSGALRLTNGYINSTTGGYRQNGAIVSGNNFDTSAGVQITFKTVTYRGDSGGAGQDGADGISFFLVDGGTDLANYSGVGAFGGSLGYTCSNVNNDATLRPDGTARGYDGLVGGYIGLGIDEYGNFLNGTTNTLGTSTAASGDNTASGGGYQPGRIGLRGAGSVAWKWLNATYPMLYPSTLTTNLDPTYVTSARRAVRDTCRTGYLWNYSNPASPVQTATRTLDYPAIPGALRVLPSTLKIANEYATGGTSRGKATPILYNLKITQDGLLSFSYSLNGGAYQPVITKQDITASNGPLPGSLRFGFAGSTGGSTNIHEIMCFKAAPTEQAGSSTSVNEKQSGKLETGTQAYFAFYDPNDWTGRLTANNLIDTGGVVTVSATANWDASCVLTGVAAGQTCETTGVVGPVAPQGPLGRTMLSSTGASGVPFEWTNLTSAQHGALNAGDATPLGSDRVSYLRGDRTKEITSSGVGSFRARDRVLGDIIDSSPAWVGPPQAGYPATWDDRIHAGAAAPETSYPQFATTWQTRLNVVYSGANDGFLHGFRAGSFDAGGNFVGGASTPNDGREVLAFMPNAIVQTIHNGSDASLDYASPQYAHNFYVDAPPGTGDLFYRGAWHTWLVGGLGPGGSAIYGLDVTNPTSFSEGSASTLVVGEWTSSNIVCVNTASCGNNLGNTYGTPQIRRLHNGTWAMIFGNGLGSTTGDAGIFVMTIDPASGATSFYYLGTGSTNDGIAYATPADLDRDYITDYVYAGDIKGNVWRFDLTSNDPSQWSVRAAPVFTTAAGQPIASKVIVVATDTGPGGAPRVMIEFGTGQKTPLTTTSPATYVGGAQDLYGFWDWDFVPWNTLSTAKFTALDAGATGLSSPYTLGKANLTQQTFTPAGPVREGSSNALCWRGSTTCSGTSFGWYVDLPGGSEQIIYNPLFYQGAFIVDSTVPANDLPTACTTHLDTGFTYVISAATGGTFKYVFRGQPIDSAGFQTNATGTPHIVTTAEQTTSLVYQTISSAPDALQINLPANTKAARLTWVELR